MSREFRVTVEDLKSGEREVREVAAGDFVLTPFAPCYMANVQRYAKAGTVVVTLRDHRPQDESLIVDVAPWHFDIPTAPPHVTCLRADRWPNSLWYRLGTRDAWTMRADKGPGDDGVPLLHLLQWGPLHQVDDARGAS